MPDASTSVRLIATLLLMHWALIACAGTPTGRLVPPESPRASGYSNSWVSADAVSRTLLYVSDVGSNNVYIYSYPQGVLRGTLKGFQYPQGECVDDAGNVWIADMGASEMVEYAHGHSLPIATLAMNGYYPYGCAYDARTGNLAVMTAGTTSGVGVVAIFANERGTPTIYTSAYVGFYFGGYDPSGNLFMDGELVDNSGFWFGELARGAAKISTVSLDQSIGYPGGVQWDGQNVAVGDARTNVIYQFVISGSNGTKKGSTTLSGACDVIQFWKQGNLVTGPDPCRGIVGVWNYPVGGPSVQTISNLDYPVGTVVSPRKQ